MTAIPNLYLKWRAFRELADVNDPDNWIGNHVFKTEDGAQRFSKLLRGDLGCSPVVAQDLTRFMNDWIGVARSRAEKGASADEPAPPLEPSDLDLPVLSFVTRLLGSLGGAAARNLDRAHQALLRDMTLELPRGHDNPRLVVERFSATRSFGADVQPSGGTGPLVFEVGKHKGQLAVIAATGAPVAAYTFFTRDPAPIGKHLWDLTWGETMLWLPAPIVPTLSEGGRLLLLRQAEPVNPMPGRFIVTCALVWQKEAIGRLDPRGGAPSAGILDEAETSRFLTNLRRLTEDKLRKWTGAVTVAQAEYVVKA